MTERHLPQAIQGLIVQDLSILHQPAVPMAGVFIDADIGDDHQPGYVVLQRGNGARNDSIPLTLPYQKRCTTRTFGQR